MAKTVSYIYDNIENLVPLYPYVAYSQPKDSRPKEKKEIELEKMVLELKKMGDDAMSLSRILDISYEQVLRWFRGVATNPERHECEGAMRKLFSNCEEDVRNQLMVICRRYSLSIVGETTRSQETSSPFPMMKSDMTVSGGGVPVPSERFKEVEHEIRKSIVGNSLGTGVTGCTMGKKEEENLTLKDSLKGDNVNLENIAFWASFKKWCLEHGRTWCTADVATRGNPYYDPQGGGECYIFFTIGERSGETKGCGPLVTIGIYCKKGEDQRNQIRKFRDDFDKQFSSCKFYSQDWEFVRGTARRILFIRKADYRNPTPDLFKRMADDYEGILSVMRAHGHVLPEKKWK